MWTIEQAAVPMISKQEQCWGSRKVMTFTYIQPSHEPGLTASLMSTWELGKLRCKLLLKVFPPLLILFLTAVAFLIQHSVQLERNICWSYAPADKKQVHKVRWAIDLLILLLVVLWKAPARLRCIKELCEHCGIDASMGFFPVLPHSWAGSNHFLPPCCWRSPSFPTHQLKWLLSSASTMNQTPWLRMD